jgi:hypothetical protein
MYGADTAEERIFEIDLTTGAALAEPSTSVPFESVGLEFDRVYGQLLASTGGALYTTDPGTGYSCYLLVLSTRTAQRTATADRCFVGLHQYPTNQQPVTGFARDVVAGRVERYRSRRSFHAAIKSAFSLPA